jgi:hypothetical protein
LDVQSGSSDTLEILVFWFIAVARCFFFAKSSFSPSFCEVFSFVLLLLHSRCTAIFVSVVNLLRSGSDLAWFILLRFLLSWTAASGPPLLEHQGNDSRYQVSSWLF